MIYTLVENDLIYNYDNEKEAILKYLDIIILKFNFLREILIQNMKIIIPDFSKIKIFYTKNSYTIDIIYFDINDFKFKNYTDNTNFKLNLSENENFIISKKINLIKKEKYTTELIITNQGIFIQNNNFHSNKTYSNDNTSDTISNLTLDLESLKSIDEESTNDSSPKINENNDITSLDIQNKKIENLIILKKQFEHNKKKKEKLEEMLRRFEIDLKIYLEIKNNKDIPELFKYKFTVFKEIEELNIIDNLDLAKKYYIKNFNRINKNIGSSIYANIFNQIEAEEQYTFHDKSI